MGRLESTLRKLSNNKEALETYAKSFEDMEALGTIEEAPATSSGAHTYYMPHQQTTPMSSVRFRFAGPFRISSI